MKLLPVDSKFLQVVDSSFSHSHCMVSDSDPKYFEWTRHLSSMDHVFLTHEKILLANEYRILGFKKIIGVFYESPSILSSTFKQIYKLGSNLDLDLLLTSNSKMLRLPNTKWIPGGGIWNYKNLIDINSLILNKKESVSLVCSGKNVTKLHKFRRRIFDKLLFDDRVVLFGPPICNPVASDQTLRNFLFSIVVENHLDPNYFTEKILNCFAQGTIPIYFGSAIIDNFFESNGIIRFSDMNDLDKILPTLTKDLYMSKIDAVINNYLFAINKFSNIENYIIDNKICTLS